METPAYVVDRSVPPTFVQPLITPAVIRELTPMLMAFASRRVGTRQDAEDLVQDTWVSALRSLSSFEGRSSLRTWLVTILRRRMSERFRRQHVGEPFDEQDFIDDASTMPERLDVAWATRIATDTLAELPSSERSAVLLCDVQELERDEASEALGVTRGHLRVLLHRGRRRVADALLAGGF